MKIYVDMDDVLCETAATLCELAEREFDKSVAYEEVRGFDLQATFGLTDGEMARFRVLSHERDTVLRYPPTPGAVDALIALRRAGHRVDIVTGRPAYTHRDTGDWLRAVGLDGFDVTYVDKYARVFESGPDDPPTVPLGEIRGRGYDVAVDDSPVVLAKLAEWSATRVLVFSRPWNRSFALASNMARVASWGEALSLIGCQAAV